MRTMLNVVLALGLAVVVSGCPTTFRGNAHVPNGRKGCEQKCKRSGLRFSSMVFMGEYSSACVCEPARPKEPTNTTTAEPSAAAAATAGAAVGAMMQTATSENEGSTPITLSN